MGLLRSRETYGAAVLSHASCGRICERVAHEGSRKTLGVLNGTSEGGTISTWASSGSTKECRFQQANAFDSLDSFVVTPSSSLLGCSWDRIHRSSRIPRAPVVTWTFGGASWNRTSDLSIIRKGWRISTRPVMSRSVSFLLLT